MFGKVSLIAGILSVSAVMMSGASHAGDVRGAFRIGDLKIIVGPDLHYKKNRRGYHEPRKRCVAVARRRGGVGRRIHRIKGVGAGPRACRKAMARCWRRLDNLKATGRNPFASCVVHRRIINGKGSRRAYY